jgi:hypothetical protein
VARAIASASRRGAAPHVCRTCHGVSTVRSRGARPTAHSSAFVAVLAALVPVCGIAWALGVPPCGFASYHISSEKIRRELGFAPAHTIEDAVRGLVDSFEAGRIPNPMTDIRYYNIKTMQARQLI